MGNANETTPSAPPEEDFDEIPPTLPPGMEWLANVKPQLPTGDVTTEPPDAPPYPTGMADVVQADGKKKSKTKPRRLATKPQPGQIRFDI